MWKVCLGVCVEGGGGGGVHRIAIGSRLRRAINEVVSNRKPQLPLQVLILLGSVDQPNRLLHVRLQSQRDRLLYTHTG